jgi:hypothetical protein
MACGKYRILKAAWNLGVFECTQCHSDALKNVIQLEKNIELLCCTFVTLLPWKMVM